MKLSPHSSHPTDLDFGVDSIRTVDQSKVDYRRDLTATLISATIHLLALLLLAFCVLPTIVGEQSILVQATFGERELLVLDTLDLSIEEMPPADQPVENPVNVPDPIPTTLVDFSLIGPSPSSSDTEDASAELNAIDTSADKPASSDSIEDAVDSVTGALEAKLKKGDVRVVWLLDSSASLVDDRQRVATRLTPFYQRIAERRSDADHELQSVVVSFGARMKERIPPTDFGEQIIAAVEALPVDRSGSERVFDAVARCAQHYRKDWPDEQLVIVVWTDESGDDVAYLENTIAICRKNQAAVSVVGPSSVLGADTGLHSYTDPKSQSNYQLPVLRGPETAMPERIELGYWYLTRMGGGRRGLRGGLPAWVGGQDLEGVLSGFSPYALTRLTMQTGGTYTIFDRPEDRSPFDPQTMARYAPSYGSLDAYQTVVRASPLRRAVMNAVRELKGKNVDAPTMMLFTKKTGDRFFDFVRYYYPPNEFQSKLRSSRVRLTRQAARYAKLIDEALAHVSQDGAPETGLDALVESEPSLRWRAWYDLTRGRLLANSVRLEEYRLTIAAMNRPGFLDPTTNHVVLTGSTDKRSEGKFINRAEEAERLLRRCVSDHRGTPWEVLAQRELDFALGVGIRQMALTPEPGPPVAKQPNLPRF